MYFVTKQKFLRCVLGRSGQLVTKRAEVEPDTTAVRSNEGDDVDNDADDDDSAHSEVEGSGSSDGRKIEAADNRKQASTEGSGSSDGRKMEAADNRKQASTEDSESSDGCKMEAADNRKQASTEDSESSDGRKMEAADNRKQASIEEMARYAGKGVGLRMCQVKIHKLPVCFENGTLRVACELGGQINKRPRNEDDIAQTDEKEGEMSLKYFYIVVSVRNFKDLYITQCFDKKSGCQKWIFNTSLVLLAYAVLKLLMPAHRDYFMKNARVQFVSRVE